MTPRIKLPLGLIDEPFRVSRASELGLTKSRLGGIDLAKPYRGLRTVGPAPATVIGLSRVYVTRMPPTHVFSHATAALVHGIPLPYRLEINRRLHVTVPAGNRPPQMLGIIGHQLRERLMDVELVEGLPVTSPLQTWIDLGPLLNRGELVAAADFLCAGREPRYTPQDLRNATARLQGRRGSRALREAASLTRAGVDSPKETEARLLIIDAGLPEPVVNYEVTDAAGGFVARVDLSWPGFRVCIEYEGDGHRTDRKRFRADITRRERIEDQRWRVIRITDDDLKAGGRELLRRVRAALKACGRRD